MRRSRQKLVEALRRTALGDTAAFETVYRATSSKLYGIIVRMLGRGALADKVLQKVFVRMWQRAGECTTKHDDETPKATRAAAGFHATRAAARQMLGSRRCGVFRTATFKRSSGPIGQTDGWFCLSAKNNCSNVLP